jgi:branched-chain amino acid transport system ATP-binding protein
MSQSPLITVENVVHRYDGVLALDDVSLEIGKGQFSAILGPNGAGKSTLALIAGGALSPTRGRILVHGKDVTASAGRSGLDGVRVALIPEGRRLFGQLTVKENLELGAYSISGTERVRRLDKVLELMPAAVRDGQNRAAITFSGGEQQMLAVGRALMSEPQVVLVDEPSLGLAPILVDSVYALLGSLREKGVSVIVFEQLAANAMQYADTVMIIDRGQIAYRGRATDAATQEALQVGYLGHA